MLDVPQQIIVLPIKSHEANHTVGEKGSFKGSLNRFMCGFLKNLLFNQYTVETMHLKLKKEC